MAKKIKLTKARPLIVTDRQGFAYTGPFSRSKVNIIIPFHAQYEKVSRLLQSIYLATRSNPYQICLIDDASPNSDFIEQVKDSPQAERTNEWEPQIICHRVEEQLGFIGAVKYGFEHTHFPWICIMHSDCHVADTRWLGELGESLLRLRESKVQMVSARSDNPGSFYDRRLIANNISDKSQDAILEKGFLPLYCVMSHRELYDHIGGFIKAYPYTGYEDEELSYRMKHFGYKQAICGKSVIKHAGGGTIGPLCKENPEIKKIIEGNRDRCIQDIKSLSQA